VPDTSPRIDPEFRTIDSLSIRFATQPRPGAPTLLLLSPWPESIFAYQPMWDALAAGFSLAAVDLPGFGRSEGRSDLMGPKPMGDFVVRIADELGLERPHALGPDVGTSTLLFAAARHPDAFTSIQVGGGATASPLRATGLLREFIEAPNLDQFRAADPGPLIAGAVRSIPGYTAPDEVVEDYVASYAGTRFAESIEFVRSYPAQLVELAALLPTIATPVHIFAANADPFTPVSDHEELQQALPHAKLTVLSNGHNAWEESPEIYAQSAAAWVNGGYQDA
jgi:pimeloyl-ACP methyl ester carboxylesterase